MKNAFLLKNERKTLDKKMRLLFSKVFGCPFLVSHMNADRCEGDCGKNKVEGQVAAPGHAAEDAAAGAGHPVPEMQQRQDDIAGEGQHQVQRQQQPGHLRPAEKQQANGQQLQRRQRVDQNIRQPVRESLVVQLSPEHGKVHQLAARRIDEQQDEQGGGQGFKKGLHRNGIWLGQSTSARQGQNSRKWVVYP
jgi:hypothetical protein